MGRCSKMLWEHQGCSNLPPWQGVRDEDGIEGSESWRSQDTKEVEVLFKENNNKKRFTLGTYILIGQVFPIVQFGTLKKVLFRKYLGSVDPSRQNVLLCRVKVQN